MKTAVLGMQRLGVAVFAVGMLLGAPAAAKNAQHLSLEDAYKKEFAFLEAQKRALKERLHSAEQELNRVARAQQAEISTLQSRVLAQRAQIESIRDDIKQSQRSNEAALEKNDLLKETFSRAQQALAGYGVKLPEPKSAEALPGGERLQALFTAARSALEGANLVRREPGKFFGADDRELAGQIVHVGRVGAYGVSPSATGALVPSAGQKLKIWPVNTKDAALALAKGSALETLPIFVYESIEKPVEEPKTKTVIGVIDSGGVIAWIIVGLGMVALVMTIVRAIVLVRTGRGTHSLASEISRLVSAKKVDQALALCQRTNTACGRVMTRTLTGSSRTRDEVEDVVAEAILKETPAIERFGSALTVIAATSPLLGLLGTVTGIIATFEVITEHGTGDPKMLSGGISEALVTTELGLIVAIPTLLLGTMLSGRAETILSGLERAALHVINLMSGSRSLSRRTANPIQDSTEEQPPLGKPVADAL